MEKTRIQMPNNIINPFDYENKQPVMIFHNEGWIEILGRRFENAEVKGIDEFVQYLGEFRDLEEKNKKLKKELNDCYNYRAALIEYLIEKIEESKLESTYGGQTGYVSIQERIYKEILDRVEGDTNE